MVTRAFFPFITGAAALVLLLGACNSDDDSNPPQGSGGGAGAGTDAQAGSAQGGANQGGSAGSSQGGAAGETTTPNIGQVLVVSGYQANGPATSLTDAKFVTGVKYVQVPWCVETAKEGTCRVLDCDKASYTGSADNPDSWSTTPNKVSGGTIAISGGSTMPPISLTWDSSTARYGNVTGDALWWKEGDKIAIKIPGDPAGPPAFDFQLDVPPAVKFTQPAPDATQVMIPRSKDFTATWTGGTRGYVIVTLSGIGPVEHFYSIACQWDATAGTGTISTALLNAVPAADCSMGRVVLIKDVQKTQDWTMSGMTESMFPMTPATLQ
jgi:hypothetical protein